MDKLLDLFDRLDLPVSHKQELTELLGQAAVLGHKMGFTPNQVQEFIGSILGKVFEIVPLRDDRDTEGPLCHSTQI